jgi:hypothetical protein
MLKSLIPARPLGRLLLAAAIATGMSTAAQADTSWLNSYAFVWNGENDTFYDLNAVGVQPENFNGANLGTLNRDTDTRFVNAEINAFADGGDVYNNFSLWYRIYSGSPTGDFTQISAPSIFVPDAEKPNEFRGIASGLDLIDGRANGNYSLQIYLSRSHTWDSGAGGPYTTYLNTLGDTGAVAPTDNFFTASYEVVPEPSTYALLGLGVAFGIWQLRRRKLA